MTQYRCYWIIDVDAGSPEEAAIAAEKLRASLRDEADGTGTWNVMPYGKIAKLPGDEIHGVRLL